MGKGSGARYTCLEIIISSYKRLLTSDRFNPVFDNFIKEQGVYSKPVSESQSLLIRNCWLQTGSFLFL